MSPTSVAQTAVEPSVTDHVIHELPVLVILPHSRCNCRCVMCDIWRIRQIREITAQDLEPHLASLRALKVRWVVFSGGEPLMHSDLPALARVMRREGIRTTLLTAGLLLERHARQVSENLDDVIVSLDGPREVHDRIRGVSGAYRRLEKGINALRHIRPSMSIHGRCTVQKLNFGHLRATVTAALELKLDSLSFLAADFLSEAFNHVAPLSQNLFDNVALSWAQVRDLTTEIEYLIKDCQESLPPVFVRESPEKLRRIVQHFRAFLGQTTPIAPRCNAPWVSAVMDSNGDLRPCFFHPPFGNIHRGALVEVLNSDMAIEFRSQLDIPRNRTCQRCVCSLVLEKSSDSVT